MHKESVHRARKIRAVLDHQKVVRMFLVTIVFPHTPLLEQHKAMSDKLPEEHRYLKTLALFAAGTACVRSQWLYQQANRKRAEVTMAVAAAETADAMAMVAVKTTVAAETPTIAAAATETADVTATVAVKTTVAIKTPTTVAATAETPAATATAADEQKTNPPPVIALHMLHVKQIEDMTVQHVDWESGVHFFTSVIDATRMVVDKIEYGRRRIKEKLMQLQDVVGLWYCLVVIDCPFVHIVRDVPEHDVTSLYAKANAFWRLHVSHAATVATVTPAATSIVTVKSTIHSTLTKKQRYRLKQKQRRATTRVTSEENDSFVMVPEKIHACA